MQYRTPCNNPQSEGEADLCAQWRAAYAAEDSAFWTRLGFWAGLFGLAGLYWQVILTRRAVEDTGDATEAMREANEIARQSVRPWLKLLIDSEFYYIPGDDASSPLIKIDAEAQNFGNAPAVNVTVHVSLLKGRSFQIAEELQRLTERGVHLGIYGTAIHPTDKRELERDTRFGVVEIEMPDPYDGAHPMIATVYYLGVAVFYRSPNTPGTFYTAAFFRFRDPTPPKTPTYWYSERIGGEHHGVAVAVAT